MVSACADRSYLFSSTPTNSSAAMASNPLREAPIAQKADSSASSDDTVDDHFMQHDCPAPPQAVKVPYAWPSMILVI